MSSIINNSNSNSALINTINASQSRMNPNIYSTKTIHPSAATVYTETQKSSGTIGASQSITFDLMKYGIAQQILLCYTKVGAGGATEAYDFMDVIDRIELLSASKVIDTLTNRDILAQFSDLQLSQYYPLSKTLVDARTAAASHLFCLPLVFGFFKDINTNLNLQFNEPMSIRLRFGANPNNNSAGTATLTKCYLKMRYKAYNESDFSEILTQNYSEPELNVMTTGFYDENVAVATLATGATNNGENGTPVELRNTDCVNDFFIMVRKQNTTAASAPLPITRVTMTASGQDIFDLSGEELYYSKLCENGFSLGGPQDATSNVAKVQVGLWEHLGSGAQSNTVSLRELNNPVIRVYFDVAAVAAETKFDIVVCERVLKIVSTVSSSGRTANSLTN